MSLYFPLLQQPWTFSLWESATFGAHVGNFPLLEERGGSRLSCSLGGNKEEAGAWAGGWAGWGGSGTPAASCRVVCLASPWAQGGENEGLEPHAIWGRQTPEELPFTPGSPMGCWLTCCPTMMGAMHGPKSQEICRARSPPAPPAAGHNGQNPAWQRGVCWQGMGSTQHFRKRAAPSLLGISFRGGQGHHEQEEESQLFRFVLIKGVNGKQKQTHLASAAQGVPAAGYFPPHAVIAWLGRSWIWEDRTSLKGTGWPGGRSKVIHPFPSTAFLLLLLHDPETNHPVCPPSPKGAFWAALCSGYLSGYQRRRWKGYSKGSRQELTLNLGH